MQMTPNSTPAVRANMRSEQVQQHIADAGAGVSTVVVGAYAMEWLEATALIVAILSGLAALSWHVYRAYREYQFRKGADNVASQTSVESTSRERRSS
jgi:uncharacterized membrane protein YebE (DUF533 family)